MMSVFILFSFLPLFWHFWLFTHDVNNRCGAQKLDWLALSCRVPSLQRANETGGARRIRLQGRVTPQRVWRSCSRGFSLRKFFPSLVL